MALIAGPVTGLAGSLLGGAVRYFERRQRIEELKIEHAHELRLQELAAKTRGEELENERLIAQAEADAASLRASYRHDASAGPAHAWVASALRLVRPVLTLGLIAVGAAIYFEAGPLDTIEGRSVREHTALTLLYLAEVAVTWWFADRARGRK